MSKGIAYFAAFLGLFLGQISLLSFFPGKSRPDILLLGIIVLGIREGGVPAMITACIVGFFKDAFTTSFIGASMLGLVIAGFLAGIFSNIHQRLGTQAKLVFLFSIILIYNLVYYFLYQLQSGINFWYLMIDSVLPAVFYTLLFAGIAHFLTPSGLLGSRK